MTKLRNLKTVVLIFALAVIFAGAFTIATTTPTSAAKCCWVRVCSEIPPYPCWDECRPCPPLPPPPWP